MPYKSMFFAVLLVLTACTSAWAFPNSLLGTWQGKEQAVHFAKTQKVNPDAVPEFVEATLVLQINKQDKGRFYGTLQRDGKQQTIIGLTDADGNLTLVGNKGTYSGQVTPSGELALTFTLTDFTDTYLGSSTLKKN